MLIAYLEREWECEREAPDSAPGMSGADQGHCPRAAAR